MVWSLETDDFNGVCGEKYPLMKIINKALGNGEHIPDPPTRPPTVAPEPTTPRPTKPGPEFKCWDDGMFRDPYDCAVFYICQGSSKHQFQCPGDLWFDTKLNNCNFKDLVDCKPLPHPHIK